MSVVKDLKKARKLLRTVGFTKHTFASRSLDGEITGYCSLGAINTVIYGRPGGSLEAEEYKELGDRELAATEALEKQLTPVVNGLGRLIEKPGIPTFNDYSDFEAVDRAFTAAIKSAKKESTK